uniref:(northern house mosquito) hypothetical protein n=1 Tax=Culex pipiens TaxID=7175 RepID=A0A8D8BFP4_CULPI
MANMVTVALKMLSCNYIFQNSSKNRNYSKSRPVQTPIESTTCPTMPSQAITIFIGEQTAQGTNTPTPSLNKTSVFIFILHFYSHIPSQWPTDLRVKSRCKY